MQDMQATALPKLLIVDDDQELVRMLGEYLGNEGFEVKIANCADSAMETLATSGTDALVLDVMLPGRSGLEFLPTLRARYPELPILMLTARGAADDRIRGLELGADDYLSKPFDPRELTARLRALLRRSRGLDQAGLHLDAHRRQASWQGRPLELTAAEFRVLQQLLSARGMPVSREALTEQALGRRLSAYDRAVDTHVSNLRRKLSLVGAEALVIRSVRGTGYELVLA